MSRQLVLTLGIQTPAGDIPHDVEYFYVRYNVEYTSGSSMTQLKDECKRIKQRLLEALPQGCSVVDATVDFNDLCDEQEK